MTDTRVLEKLKGSPSITCLINETLASYVASTDPDKSRMNTTSVLAVQPVVEIEDT